MDRTSTNRDHSFNIPTNSEALKAIDELERLEVDPIKIIYRICFIDPLQTHLRKVDPHVMTTAICIAEVLL